MIFNRKIDLPEVIDYREALIPIGKNQKLIKGDILKTDWINNIKNEIVNRPVLIIASGLFHYFTKKDVIKAIQNLMIFENSVELVFDALNYLGIKGVKKYMKQLGHNDAIMYFYVNVTYDLGHEIGENVKLIKEEKYYSKISKEGMNFITKTSMIASDLFNMVKMIHLKLK